MKKITAILLIAVLLLSLSSCGEPIVYDEESYEESEEEVINYTMKLVYSRNDSLNPFYLDTVMNGQISTLVFDGLFKLDKSYNPKPCAAYAYVASGNTVTVTLDDVMFSDGTQVTVGDVIYSFNAAKESVLYMNSLSNITSCSSGEGGTVIFSLEEPDPYAVSCLDFPIIKQGSDLNLPVGCGRYYFQKNGEEVYLVVNRYRKNFNPIIRVIKLESILENESVESSLVIGNTAFFYDDLEDGVYERVDARSVDMGINSFVYLGMNSSSKFFESPLLRQAVSYALDRTEIVSSAFRSHARETSVPFNPDWYAVSDGTYSTDIDLEKAKELVEESGYNLDNGEVTILYNKENEFKTEMADIIAKSLSEVGFHVRLKGFSPQAYRYDLKEGAFDIYIGEMMLCDNMNLTPLLSGDYAYGISKESPGVEKYTQFLQGKLELMDFINAFSEDMPIVPVCYRNALCLFTKSMSVGHSCCDNDIFYDIESWSLG